MTILDGGLLFYLGKGGGDPWKVVVRTLFTRPRTMLSVTAFSRVKSARETRVYAGRRRQKAQTSRVIG